jgi:hypothetical protein
MTGRWSFVLSDGAIVNRDVVVSAREEAHTGTFCIHIAVWQKFWRSWN